MNKILQNTQVSQQVGDEGLAVEGLAVQYGDKTVLNDVSFSIGRGRLISLLGPSGCGKTTTLNAIAGFVGASRGRIVLNGEDITHRPPNQRRTTVVFQNYALFPHMTVFNNVAYGLRLGKPGKAEVAVRVQDILDLLQISALSERYPSELSGGQQQRVALARALAVRPSLLLLDEPLSNLDARLRQDIRVEIRSLQQELDQTAVFVTHDREEALVVSDYVAVMNGGYVEQFGSPESIWNSPRTAYVADFMGVENILHSDEVVGAGSFGPRLRKVAEMPGCTAVGFRPSEASLFELTAAHAPTPELAGTVLHVSYSGNAYRYECGVVTSQGSKSIWVEQLQGGRQFVPGDGVAISVTEHGLMSLSG